MHTYPLPKIFQKKIKKSFSQVNYVPMDYSRIYLNYNDFIQSQRKNFNIKNSK